MMCIIFCDIHGFTLIAHCVSTGFTLGSHRGYIGGYAGCCFICSHKWCCILIIDSFISSTRSNIGSIAGSMAESTYFPPLIAAILFSHTANSSACYSNFPLATRVQRIGRLGTPGR